MTAQHAEAGLLCPSCARPVKGVKWTRRRKGGVVRGRKCPCGRSFATRETVIGYTGVTGLQEVQQITPVVQPGLVLLEHATGNQ